MTERDGLIPGKIAVPKDAEFPKLKAQARPASRAGLGSLSMTQCLV